MKKIIVAVPVLLMTSCVEPSAVEELIGSNVALQSRQVSSLVSYSGSNVSGGDVRVHEEFVPAMDRINGYAANRGVELRVQSSFRRAGAHVPGAIVKPAKRSNHLVGHAIDVNIVYGGVLYNSTDLHPRNLSNLPEAVRAFIEDVRNDSGLRWGGDFKDVDPVHIDDHFNANDDAWQALCDDLQ